MTLRLTDEETAALRAYAELHSISMQEAAREGVRRLVQQDRVKTLSAYVRERDRELLNRLAK